MIKSPIKCCWSKLKIKISNSIDCLMEKVTEESDDYTIVICPVDKLIIKKILTQSNVLITVKYVL